MNLLDVLEKECWSLICENYSNGDDCSIGWVVVGYFMDKPYERVIGYSSEHEGCEVAIIRAMKKTEKDSYAYYHPYVEN